MKFAEEIAQHVKLFMYHPELAKRNSGRVYWVKKSTDADYPSFVAEHPAYEDAQAAVYTTIQAAVNACSGARNEVIFVSPGDYDEAVTIAVGKTWLTLVGLGGRGSVFITRTGATTNLTNNAEGTTLFNITLEGDETSGSIGLLNRGKRLRYIVGRILNVETCARFTLGTPTEVTAGTFSDGSDTLCEDVEFSWATNGVQLVGVEDTVGGGDFGTTQNYFRRCVFHNCTAYSIGENPSDVTQSFRDLEVSKCTFRRVEAGTEPTAYILLNDDNANSGIVEDCAFPTALAGGKNLVSTALIWTSNKHTGGISNGQPS